MDINILDVNSYGLNRGIYSTATGNVLPDATCNALIAAGNAVLITYNVGNPARWNAANTSLVNPITGADVCLGGGITTGRTILTSSTLALTDANTRIACNHATVPVVCTIPNDATVAWANETIICLYQGLAAACSFAAGAGVTIHTLDTSVQYGILTALKIGANEWTVQK